MVASVICPRLTGAYSVHSFLKKLKFVRDVGAAYPYFQPVGYPRGNPAEVVLTSAWGLQSPHQKAFLSTHVTESTRAHSYILKF